MTDTVLLAIDGPRATITLNDPAKHNRLDPGGLGQLTRGDREGRRQPRRAGHGAHRRRREDLLLGLRPRLDPGRARSAPVIGRPTRTASRRSWTGIEAMRMPTLCALNGGVYGGATDMALACDFRLGVKGMRFFMPAARFGLHYYPSGLRRYTQKVSPSFAKRAFLLSEDFTDEDLLRCGLSRLAGGTNASSAAKSTRSPPARRLGAAFHGEHEACHRAVRPGRARHPGNPRGMRECATSEDLREGLSRPAREAAARLQGPLIDHATSSSRHRPRRHRGLHPHDGGRRRRAPSGT